MTDEQDPWKCVMQLKKLVDHAMNILTGRKKAGTKVPCEFEVVMKIP